jgi:hypothetical protein
MTVTAILAAAGSSTDAKKGAGSKAQPVQTVTKTNDGSTNKPVQDSALVPTPPPVTQPPNPTAGTAIVALPALQPMPDLEAVCSKDPAKLGDVGFDARDGTRFGPSHVAATDHVSVVIFSKNPFLYSYRLNVTSAPTDLSRVSAFATALQIAPAGVIGGFNSPDQTQQCNLISTPYGKVTESLSAFQKASTDSKSSCSSLYAAGKPLFDNTKALIDAWNANATVGCTAESPDDVKNVTAAVDATRKAASTFANSTNFIDTTHVAIPDEPTTITVELFRTQSSEASAQEEKVFRGQIEVGTSRVSVSLGGAWLSLPVRNVIRQPIKQPDGTAQLGFGYDENSSSHFAPILLLHGAIVEIPQFLFLPTSEIDATFGAAVPVSGPAVDFVLGGTWGFARTVYLTFGCEFAKVTQIAGGFSEGDLVPSSLQDPLPTEKKLEIGAVVGLSWRIK